MMHNTAQYAVRYIGLGLTVIPLSPRTKVPSGKHWTNFTDAQEANDFFTKNPYHNIGVNLGLSRVCSADLDWPEAIEMLDAEFGFEFSSLDQYHTIEGRAKRVMFKVPPGMDLPYIKLNWRTKDGTNRTVFELRAATPDEQRQDVLPPSIHPDTGNAYQWLNPPKDGLVEPPEWLLKLWQNFDIIKSQLAEFSPWAIKQTKPIPSIPRQDGDSVSAVFDQAHDIYSTLELYGYARCGNRYLSPHSQTKMPGVHVFEDANKCWIHHASDPLCSEDSGHPVGPFDLYTQFEFNGDYRAATKAAAKDLGIDHASKNTVPGQSAPPSNSQLLGDAKGKREQITELDYVFADSIGTEDEKFDDEIVERVLMRDGMSVIYGDSNSGKTFLAVHLAACMATGARFLDRRTVPGAVIYLATEAAGSVIRRVKAYKKRFGIDHMKMVVVKSPINLFDGTADTTRVIDLVKKIEIDLGEKVTMVIGDTMARISAGANENSGEDMGVILKHADQIKNECQTHFLWIHHNGKNAAAGMRGWSGIRAAIDTEIEVIEDKLTGIRTVEITKQRDIEGKGDRYGFTLESVDIGVNQWGVTRTSCVVVQALTVPEKTEKTKRMSAVEIEVLDVLFNKNEPMSRPALNKILSERGRAKSGVYTAINNLLESGKLLNDCGMLSPK
jgi:RecA-family ATPase